MLKIALGTKSDYKVAAVRKILYELDIYHEIYPFGVNSEVSEQPNKPGEVKQGSINRAKNALSLKPECDLGLGVEFGYEPFSDGTFHIVCWASVWSNEGLLLSEHSSSLELPKQLTADLLADRPLDITHENLLAGLLKGQANRHMFFFLKKRRVMYECVENVMLRYYCKNLY